MISGPSNRADYAGRAVGPVAGREEALEERIRRLEAALKRLEQTPVGGSAVYGAGNRGVVPAGYSTEYPGSSLAPGAAPAKFETGYDKGFYIRSTKAYRDELPFELKINGRMQFRWTGFKRDSRTFFNRENPPPGGLIQESRNDFELERARLIFSGHFYDPNLQFYLQLDGDTDDNHRAVYHDFWVNYVFSEAFNLYVGKAFVPGSREWLNGSSRAHLADRSMATTFFRPDRSVGIWAIGEIAEGLFYRAMVSNGFNTTDLERGGLQVDDQLTYSASMWWHPLGDFGKGFADLAYHEDPVVQVGHSFTYSPTEPIQATGAPRLEQRAFRLSDGSRLVSAGVLAPGVTLNKFDVYLYAVDFALKYRGWSVNSEYYFRWLQDFKTSGGSIPFRKLYTDGFYADVGYMVLKKKLELVGRISAVDGFFGDAWEYAAGVNWYVNGSVSNRLTFDVTVLDGNPASSSSPGFEVGMDGIMYRLQWDVGF